MRDYLVHLKRTTSGSRVNSCTDLLEEISTAEQIEDKMSQITDSKNSPPETVENVKVFVNRQTDSTQSTPTLRRSARLNPEESRSHTNLYNDNSQNNSDDEEALLREIESELEAEHREREAKLRQETERELREEYERKQKEEAERKRKEARERER